MITQNLFLFFRIYSLHTNFNIQIFSGHMQQSSHSTIAVPSQQAVGTGRKRLESYGTRTVSAPKRAKQDSTGQHEHEISPRVGDRSLQTTEHRYGPYSSIFNNPDEARARLTSRQWTPPHDPNYPIPTTAQEMLPYVTQVYDAMVDTQSGFYDKVNVANRILNGKYHLEVVEATAWLIVVCISCIYFCR